MVSLHINWPRPSGESPPGFLEDFRETTGPGGPYHRPVTHMATSVEDSLGRFADLLRALEERKVDMDKKYVFTDFTKEYETSLGELLARTDSMKAELHDMRRYDKPMPPKSNTFVARLSDLGYQAGAVIEMLARSVEDHEKDGYYSDEARTIMPHAVRYTNFLEKDIKALSSYEQGFSAGLERGLANRQQGAAKR